MMVGFPLYRLASMTQLLIQVLSGLLASNHPPLIGRGEVDSVVVQDDLDAAQPAPLNDLVHHLQRRLALHTVTTTQYSTVQYSTVQLLARVPYSAAQFSAVVDVGGGPANVSLSPATGFSVSPAKRTVHYT